MRKTVEIYNDLMKNDTARTMLAAEIGELAVKYHEIEKEHLDDDNFKEKTWDDIAIEALTKLLACPLDRDG